jgi:Flp pilus assembly pilin Flp
MLQLVVRLHVLALSIPDRLTARLDDERGQTTAEYALVLLGAASVALLIAMWAKSGGKVGKLLDTLFDSLIKMVRS